MDACAPNGFLLLWYIILAVSCESSSGDGVKKSRLDFLVLLPFEIQGSSEQPWFKEGQIILPVAELAVEQREDLLTGYSVNLTVANSACDIKVHTIINFVTAVFYSGVKFAGIVEPVCSDAVKFISPITRQEGVSLLNFHAGSSLQFTDRNRYRYAFSTVSSINGLVMKDNKWESVVVLYDQQTTVFLNGYDLLVKELPKVYPQGKISFSAPVSDDSLPLSAIEHQRLRVVIVLSAPSLALKIMCLIQRRFHQLTFPAYQFVIIGVHYAYFHSHESVTLNRHHDECSAKEISHVMEGFLLTAIMYQKVVNGSATE